MYYLTDSPTVLTDIPDCRNCSISSTDDGRFVAFLFSNRIYFHCQKSFILLGQYTHKSEFIESGGNLVYASWNSRGDTLITRTELGFLCLIYLSIQDIGSVDSETFVRSSCQLTVKSVRFLQKLGQFSCCIPTCNKIIAGSRSGRVMCLSWQGEVLQNEGFDLHSLHVQSEFGSNAVTSRIDPAVNSQYFYWAPTLGGFIIGLTNGRLLLVILPLTRLDPKLTKAVWLTSAEFPSNVAVNHRFRGFATSTSTGSIVSYQLEETSNLPVTAQKFRLPDPVKHGIEKMPRSVKTMVWSPDGYCLAVAWNTHGMALWSVFGSLLYSTLLDQTEVTRFLAPLNFCWTMNGYHLWTVATFVDDPDRRAREECLNAFRERLLHSCNALPQTRLQIAKNVAKMQADLRLNDDSHEDHYSSPSGKSNAASSDGAKRNPNFLMVFHLTKSALTSNPTVDNHMHLMLCAPDSVKVTTRRFLHSRRSMLHVPLPPAYIGANFPLKFAALNSQGSLLLVAGSRGFAMCSLSSLQWRLFGNITQEQAFEVHAGLAWWDSFICFCAFNYGANRCEIRCYPSSERLDDRFASVLPLDSLVRPLLLDVVGNRIIIFSTDSQYRSFDLSVGSRPHEVLFKPRHTFNLASFFPHPSCLTSIFPFTPHSYTSKVFGKHSLVDEDKCPPKAAEAEDSTLLATYAGNLLLLPNLHTSSLTQASNGTSSSAGIAGFFGFSSREDESTRKYRDTITPTLIASRVELLWSPTLSTYSLAASPQRPLEVSDDSESDGEDGNGESMECTDPSLFPSISAPPLPLLGDSIWLFCGADGVRIWLPLDTGPARRVSSGVGVDFAAPQSPGVEKKPVNPLVSSNASAAVGSGGGSAYFPLTIKASRRVMISMGLDGSSYPLVVFLDKGVIVTLQSDYLRTERSYSDVLSDPYIQMPCYCVNFKTNLFLPHLLKDLLRKNLSDVAFDLASAYQHLPYFQHILELFLHEVLEEEATSKYPIPDPLLPQVTAFIEQFGECFLSVVVQCTRKTEVTWWRHLFCALGRRPKALFEEALAAEQLDTAASCLVILQNSESHATCKHCALLLLETAIKESQWHHVKDLIRFLKATTLSERSTDVLNEVDSFVEQTKCRFLREGAWKSLEEIFANLPMQHMAATTAMTSQIDMVDSADAVNSVLPQWLLDNRQEVMQVDDWPMCFQRLHATFDWFIPLGSSKDSAPSRLCKRPGFARPVNSSSRNSFLEDPETSPPQWDPSVTEEAPTYHQALRSLQQVRQLLRHLLLVLRELKPSTPRGFFSPCEEALFSWALLVAILQLDRDAVLSILDLLLASEVGKEATVQPPPSLLHILNGLEALEGMLVANQRSSQEYLGFFAELKRLVRKTVHPFLETTSSVAKRAVAVDEKPIHGDRVIPKPASSALPVANGSASNQASVPGMVSSSMLTYRAQSKLASDFESSVEDHLVHPGSADDKSSFFCTVS